MMARSTASNQRPNTLMQNRLPPAHEIFLQRTAGPYIRVKRRNTRTEQMSTALPPRTDIVGSANGAKVVGWLGFRLPLARRAAVPSVRHQILRPSNFCPKCRRDLLTVDFASASLALASRVF